jgi:hypothetical protein
MSEMAVEKFDQPMEFDQYLGQLDMEKHPLWKKAWVDQDKEAFEQILEDLGADISYGYDFRVCLHRSRMTNQVEYGVRVGFKERTDKWWTANMLSVEDLVRTTRGSIRATGMKEALNQETPLSAYVEDQMAKSIMHVEKSVVKVDRVCLDV